MPVNNRFSRRSFLGYCGAIAIHSAFSTTASSNSNADILLAGIAKSDITPQPGIDIAGSMQRQIATHVHDPLYVRCLVLDNAQEKLLLLLVDSCMLPDHICNKAKEQIQETLHIQPDHILIAATHTHSAPCATPVFLNEPDLAYQEQLISHIVDCANAAFVTREPARIAFGRGNLPDEVFNRRWHMHPEGIAPNPWGETSDKVRMNPPRQSDHLIRPAGPTDPEIPFIALQRLDGTALAIFANYALHYVGGVEGGAISADYFGCFSNTLEDMLAADNEGKPVLAMLTNGASGDINNIDFTAPAPTHKPYEQMQHVAQKVAQEVHQVYHTLVFHDFITLQAITSDILLGTRLPNDEEIEVATKILEQAEGQEPRTLQEIYARETILLQNYPEKVSTKLQALRIGEMAVAATPCEVFAEIGLDLKSAGKTSYLMPIGLANGYHGYLPTKTQHDLGGYETWRARSSYLKEDAASLIQEELIKMLRQIT